MSIRDLELETLSEMSMVDIVYHLLKESNKQPIAFQQILDEVMTLKGISEEHRIDVMSRLYTEINIDGRFKALGDNVWGLRSWYPVEQAEEIVITDVKKKTKKKRYDDDDLEELDDLDDEDIDDLDDLDDLDDDLEDYDEDIDEDLDSDDDLDSLDEELDDLDDDSIDSDEDYDEDLDDLDEEEDFEDLDEDEDS